MDSTVGLALRVGVVTALFLPLGLVAAVFRSIPGFINFLQVWTHDLFLLLGNISTPPLKRGSVVPAGFPGHKGIWPPFVAPKEGDSRGPCPYLNALANHGLISHTGKNINLTALAKVMHDSFNISSTLCNNNASSVAKLFGRACIDLSDLSAHNVIEHDASLLRHDAHFQEDQSMPSKDLIHALLASASGPASPLHPEGYLTPADLSRFLLRREADSKTRNPHFKLGPLHRFFGLSNATLLFEVVQGDVATCRTVFLEERLPEGFESSILQRWGLTMKEFHLRSLQIFLTQQTGIHV